MSSFPGQINNTSQRKNPLANFIIATFPCFAFNISKQSHTMDHSPLARLPRELRDEIYFHVFHRHETFHLRALSTATSPDRDNAERWDVTMEDGGYHRRTRPKHMLALTRTCLKTRLEAYAAFFATTAWVITISDDEGLLEWLDRLSPSAAASFKHVEVCADFGYNWDWGGGEHHRIASTVVQHYRTIASHFVSTQGKLKLVVLGMEMPGVSDDALDDESPNVMNFEVEGASALDATCVRDKLVEFAAVGDLVFRQASKQVNTPNHMPPLENALAEMGTDWGLLKDFLSVLVDELES